MSSIANLFAGLGTIGQRSAPAPARPAFEAPRAEQVRGDGVEIRLSPQARQALEAYRPGAMPKPEPAAPAPALPRRLDLRV